MEGIKTHGGIFWVGGKCIPYSWLISLFIVLVHQLGFVPVHFQEDAQENIHLSLVLFISRYALP